MMSGLRVMLLHMSLLISMSGNAPHVEAISEMEETLEELLDTINEATTGNLGSLCVTQAYRSVKVPLRVEMFDKTRQKADMIARLLTQTNALDNQEMLNALLINLLRSDSSIQTARLITFKRQNGLTEMHPHSAVHVNRPVSPYADPQIQNGYGFNSSSYVALPHRMYEETDNVTQPEPITVAYANETQLLNDTSEMNITQSAVFDVTVTSDAPSAGLLVKRPKFKTLTLLDSSQSSRLVLNDLPWYEDPFTSDTWKSSKFIPNAFTFPYQVLGWWTYPYYWCFTGKWQITYSIPVHSDVGKESWGGLLSLDIDVSFLDINQCDDNPPEVASKKIYEAISYFAGTHRCHNLTSACNFTPGLGWIRGGYSCTCRPGFYAITGNSELNGSKVEIAWKDKSDFNSTAYDLLYRCVPCPHGCDSCVGSSPCLAPFSWGFGMVLLVISMIWAAITVAMMAAIYKYRRLKVFKVASPIFLCITLLGCTMMYFEMVAIFPPMDTASCIATKWTRHLGFCITYTALLMKTWRVSLTYRVKSAHKLKLTDQQLLQWMFPILLIMVVYLGAWSASSPPEAEILVDTESLKYTQCTYNWWDHGLAIGEVLFLLWGIKVCYSVRRAETYYDESRHISWAIYNIAVVNTVMASLHLIFLPHVGPDMKYLFGFIRTQLSTTVTIAIVFGPKFYLVFQGRADEHDARARARGVTASFSLNGLGTASDEEPDLQRENDELKDELQKLAGQMEFMKIVHMGINNPHLKPKPGSHFNATHLNLNLSSANSKKDSEPQLAISVPALVQLEAHMNARSPILEDIVLNDSPTIELLSENT